MNGATSLPGDCYRRRIARGVFRLWFLPTLLQVSAFFIFVIVIWSKGDLLLKPDFQQALWTEARWTLIINRFGTYYPAVLPILLPILAAVFYGFARAMRSSADSNKDEANIFAIEFMDESRKCFEVSIFLMCLIYGAWVLFIDSNHQYFPRVTYWIAKKAGEADQFGASCNIRMMIRGAVKPVAAANRPPAQPPGATAPILSGPEVQSGQMQARCPDDVGRTELDVAIHTALVLPGNTTHQARNLTLAPAFLSACATMFFGIAALVIAMIQARKAGPGYRKDALKNISTDTYYLGFILTLIGLAAALKGYTSISSAGLTDAIAKCGSSISSTAIAILLRVILRRAVGSEIPTPSTAAPLTGSTGTSAHPGTVQTLVAAVSSAMPLGQESSHQKQASAATDSPPPKTAKLPPLPPLPPLPELPQLPPLPDLPQLPPLPPLPDLPLPPKQTPEAPSRTNTRDKPSLLGRLLVLWLRLKLRCERSKAHPTHNAQPSPPVQVILPLEAWDTAPNGGYARMTPQRRRLPLPQDELHILKQGTIIDHFHMR